MHFAKYLCIFYATYKILQNSVVNFCKNSFLKKKQCKTYFRIFTKFSVQHVIDFKCNQKMRCGYILIISRTFCNDFQKLPFQAIFCYIVKIWLSKNLKPNFHDFIQILTKNNDFTCLRERSTCILFGN